MPWAITVELPSARMAPPTDGPAFLLLDDRLGSGDDAGDVRVFPWLRSRRTIDPIFAALLALLSLGALVLLAVAFLLTLLDARIAHQPPRA
jgi:hypothetical protein